MDTHYFHSTPAILRRPSARNQAPTSRQLRVRRVMSLLGKLMLPAAFVALAVVNVHFLDRTPNFCVYRTLFGVRCLGCGMTHAFCAVLHGQFAAAFSYNPLVIIAFPFFGAMGLSNLRSLLGDVRRGF